MTAHTDPRRFAKLLLGVFFATFSAACATGPQEVPPPLQLGVEHYSGTILTGPVADEPLLQEAPWTVELRIIGVDALQPDSGAPLSSHVQHVFVETSAAPLRIHASLAAGVRVEGATSALPQAQWELQRAGTLWPGSTVRWSTTAVDSAADPSRTRWEALKVSVSRPSSDDGACQVALAFQGWVRTPAGQQRLAHESQAVLLDLEQLPLEETLRVYLPAPRVNFPHAAQVLELRVERAPDLERADLQARIEQHRADLTEALVESRSKTAVLDEQTGFELERLRALEALEGDRMQRPALIFLGNATGASPTAEIALLAEEEWLAEFLDVLRADLATSESPLNTPQSLGWFLESATYRWLAQLSDDSERELPAEFNALLLRHSGELGRHPDLVLETVEASVGQSDLQARFVAENRIFLEDSHPAARVRAYDWLAARDLAPAHYDPLDSRDARRAALATLAHEQESEEQAP